MKARSMTQRTRLSQHLLWLLAVLVSFVAFGCTIELEDDPTDPPIESCDDPQPVKGINPATGACEWTTSCEAEDWAPCGSESYDCSEIPLEYCALDDRCEPVSVGVCPGCDPSTNEACPPCTTEDLCEEKTSGCSNLDEASCAQDPACYPEYGWTGATGSDSDSTRPTDGAPTDDEPDATLPAEDQPIGNGSDWAFIGCFDVPTGPCEGLDEYSCINARECSPVYEGVPCDCPTPDVDGGSGNDSDWACNCAPVEGYAGCEWIPTNDECENMYDPYECAEMPGCSWVEEGGAREMYPCDCAEGEDCDCPTPDIYYPGGYCTSEPNPPSCYDLYDPDSCYSLPGCAWYEDVTTQGPDFCACPDDESDCGCADDPVSPYPRPAGYCGPEEQPITCYDLYDPASCYDYGCEWVDGVIDAPPPCECAPGEMCNCIDDGTTEPGQDEAFYGACVPPVEEGCWNYYDEYSCTSNPDCEWSNEDWGPEPDPEPCGCPIDDANCTCVGGGGAAPYPGGFCHERNEPQGCADLYDEYSCNSHPDCSWTFEEGGNDGLRPCDCADEDPNCACTDPAPPMGGFCSENVEPPPSCADLYDEYSCISTPDCAWRIDGAGFAPPYPDCPIDVRLDEAGECFGADGIAVDLHCCEEPEFYGYCTEAEPNECGAINTVDECLASGCSWEELAVPCFCEDPDLGCDCPLVGVCQ